MILLQTRQGYFYRWEGYFFILTIPLDVLNSKNEEKKIQLDSTQTNAVQHIDSPLLVTAGPGSGKTRVITERIKFLIDSGITPSEILCLTFSEKATNEIRERLEDDESVKGETDISEMEISTYHAFCRALLLENVSSTGISMNGGIMERSVFLAWGVQNIDQFEFDEHVVMINNEFEIIENIIDGISVFSQELISPETLEKYVKEKLTGVLEIADDDEREYIHQLNNLVRVYKKYVEFKKKIDVMDYDDLIVEANNLLSNNNRVAEYVQNKFKHILIDEFQDNNFAQFEIVKKISKDGNVTAVGDPDQNIYSFQGAYRGIFEDFKTTFPNFVEILLTNNYRNTPNTTALSNELLNQDAGRLQKQIVSVKDDDTLVHIVQCSSEFSQIHYIMQVIENKMVENPSYTFNDFAIFSRKQQHGMKIAERLVSEGVPVKYVGNAKIKTSSGAQVVLALLRTISNPTNSMVPIVRILQEYGISEDNISRISREAIGRARENGENDGMFSVLQDLQVKNLSQQKELNEICNMINQLIKDSHGSLPSQILYQIIRNKTDIYKRLTNDESLKNFVERSVLKDMIDNSYDLEKIKPDATIKDFLDFQTMLTTFDVETRRNTLNSNAIQVSTIHKSKGLEFKIVFLIDIATNKIPMRFTRNEYYVPAELSRGVTTHGDPKDEHLKEERRILYVGMTRAIDDLHITYPTQYENSTRANRASKFIQELRPDRNPRVDFILHDGGAGNQTTPIDRIDAIRNEYADKAIKSINTGHYQSAIQKIVDLAKIEHYKLNKTTEGFSSDDFLNCEIDDTVNLKINCIDVPQIGYERKRISYSRLDKYKQCPKMFWYTYVLNVLPENQIQPTLYKGDLFHKIVEQSANRKMQGQIDTVEKLTDEVNSKWNTRKFIGYSQQRESQDKQTVKQIVETYLDWDKKNPNTIVGVEIEFNIELGGYTINGKIDRVEQTPDGEYVIVDYKTGGKNKEITNINESLQLNIYAIALERKEGFGKLPKMVSYFYPEKEGQQVFSYEVNQTDIDTTIQTLKGYLQSIDSGEFDATPNLKKCGWCNFKDICEESMK
jgi:DNA helicase II / ATP-dependent DNA helicase PcrA